MTIERIYTVPLRRGILTAPRTRRAKKAVLVLGAFVKKHMKCSEYKLSEKLNEHIWQNGMRNPIMKVKIIATKTDKGDVSVRLFGEEAPKEVKKSEVAKIAKKPIKKDEAKPAEVVAEKKEDTTSTPAKKTTTMQKKATDTASKATKKTAKPKEE